MSLNDWYRYLESQFESAEKTPPAQDTTPAEASPQTEPSAPEPTVATNATVVAAPPTLPASDLPD
ncbi:MAG: hypothetical protein NZ520_12140, partial [bacterium]|nr:hypothetical protein [bacterium]